MCQGPARTLGVRLLVYEVQTRADLHGAFTAMAKDAVESLLAQNNAMFLVERAQIAALALKYRLPSIGHTKSSSTREACSRRPAPAGAARGRSLTPLAAGQ
jgi:hypothetical protein